MRRLVVVLLALVVVPSAAAKGPFQVCGSSGCATLSQETQVPVRLFGVPSGTATIAPPDPAPYFVIKFADIDESLGYWVPSASAIRIVPQNAPAAWVATLPAEESLLREKTAGLRAYAPPARVAVYVDYERVKSASGWLKLATSGTPVTLTAPRRWLEIWFIAGRSPWNDGSLQLRIARTGNYLMRDGIIVTIPKRIADRVRRRLPLP